jgi:hypothetical protein
MKKVALFVVAVAAFLALVSPIKAASTATGATVTTFPVDVHIENPCGETIHAVGELQNVVQIFTDAAGVTHIVVTVTFQGVSATGDVTGTPYVWASAARSSALGTYPNGPFVVSATSTSRLVALGSAETGYLVHSTFHLTINPDGTVTVSFQRFSIDCE